MRSHSTGGDTSRKAAAVEDHQSEGAGAEFLAAISSEPYRMQNLQQEMRDTVPGHNPSSVASQQQEKQQSVLQVAPMAFRFPTYGEHFRYELSKFKRFWSCDLHYRDWRQIFAASPFPNVMPPNRLLTVRAFLCLTIFVAEFVATAESYRTNGWPIFLYFTNTYCLLGIVLWILLTLVSFHALRTWKEPLYANSRSPTGSQRWEGSTTAARGRNVTSASTTGQSSEICCEAFSTNGNRASSTCSCDAHFLWPTTVHAGEGAEGVVREQPVASYSRAALKKARANLKNFWRMQGYEDLLADPRFCVNGIIFAPNPTCPPVDQVWQRVVPGLWMLHSLQLIASSIVFIAFFALMRANGTSFTESWYTVWRHLVFIIINVSHSVLLTRIPFPVCHVSFAYIVWLLYLIVQVFVFAFRLSNGDGDRGCVYRVLTLNKPLQFIAYGVASLILIMGVTVCWWSLLRQRSVDVDPPPSASVPAAQLMEREECTDGGEAGQQLGKKEQSCLGSWRTRYLGKGKTHKQHRSANEACS